MSRKCRLCGNTKNPNLTLHRFPSDIQRKNIWLSILDLADVENLPQNLFICSEHFDPKDFGFRMNGVKYLKLDADPVVVNPFFDPGSPGSSTTDKETAPSVKRFPKDSNLRKKWIQATGRENFNPSPHSRICSKHFAPDSFNDNPWTSKRDLSKDAVPSIFHLTTNTKIPTANSPAETNLSIVGTKIANSIVCEEDNSIESLRESLPINERFTWVGDFKNKVFELPTHIKINIPTENPSAGTNLPNEETKIENSIVYEEDSSIESTPEPLPINEKFTWVGDFKNKVFELPTHIEMEIPTENPSVETNLLDEEIKIENSILYEEENSIESTPRPLPKNERFSWVGDFKNKVFELPTHIKMETSTENPSAETILWNDEIKIEEGIVNDEDNSIEFPSKPLSKTETFSHTGDFQHSISDFPTLSMMEIPTQNPPAEGNPLTEELKIEDDFVIDDEDTLESPPKSVSKKKRLSYIGDFKQPCCGRECQYRLKVNEKLIKNRTKIKTLQQKNRRLLVKVSKLKSLVERLERRANC